MTEDEAKSKWCPYSRPAGWEAPGGYNRDRDGNSYVAANCIASACMAWRKDGYKFKDGLSGRLVDQDLTGHGAWIETGYCGLAGEPK